MRKKESKLNSKLYSLHDSYKFLLSFLKGNQNVDEKIFKKHFDNIFLYEPKELQIVQSLIHNEFVDELFEEAIIGFDRFYENLMENSVLPLNWRCLGEMKNEITASLFTAEIENVTNNEMLERQYSILSFEDEPLCSRYLYFSDVKYKRYNKKEYSRFENFYLNFSDDKIESMIKWFKNYKFELFIISYQQKIKCSNILFRV